MTANFEHVPCPPGVNYRVQPGDTLEAIARRFCVPLDAIIAANPSLNPCFLTIGQLIIVPYQQNNSVGCGSHCHYTVVQGDTFCRIAYNHGISLDDLKKANPYVDPEKLTPGQTLRIPHSANNGTSSCGIPLPAGVPFTPGGKPSTCSSATVTYIVQVNDTLNSIACKFNTTETTLKNANPGINMNSLTPGQIIVVSPPWNLYNNPDYNITFKYPANWWKCDEHRYEGPDGFVQVLITNGTITIDDFCQSGFSAWGSTVNPYYNLCQGQCIIYWQGNTSCGHEIAIFIVKYPKPLTINNMEYKYVILMAHRNFIQEIVKSFSFIKC